MALFHYTVTARLSKGAFPLQLSSLVPPQQGWGDRKATLFLSLFSIFSSAPNSLVCSSITDHSVVFHTASFNSGEGITTVSVQMNSHVGHRAHDSSSDNALPNQWKAVG